MRALLLGPLLALAACNSTKNPITPKGTVILDWDHTKATRATFAKATVGQTTTKEFVVTVRPQGSMPFTIDLHVVLAPVEFVEGGATVHHTAPVEIKATVDGNTGWKLGGKCLEGPNYPMGSLDDAGAMTTPEAMVQGCSIRYDRIEGTIFESSYQLGSQLNIYGNGTVEPFPDEGVEIKPK